LVGGGVGPFTNMLESFMFCKLPHRYIKKVLSKKLRHAYPVESVIGYTLNNQNRMFFATI
jgi:hypothetical protein